MNKLNSELVKNRRTIIEKEQLINTLKEEADNTIDVLNSELKKYRQQHLSKESEY